MSLFLSWTSQKLSTLCGITTSWINTPVLAFQTIFITGSNHFFAIILTALNSIIKFQIFKRFFIIQGSVMGPASYVITASDLHTVTPGNAMVKYADDTYLIVPASNAQSAADEIKNVETWAHRNNLKLNRA